MKRSAAVLVVVLVTFLLTGCRQWRDRPDNAGWLEASWTGADTGSFAAPASAEWCSERRLLEIRAIEGDTGMAIVLYPVDSIEADTYRVVTPEGAESQAPSAGVGLRVFESAAIQGYQGDSGTMVLEQSRSGELSGTVEARVRSVVGSQRLTLAGKVGGLVVAPQIRGCGPETPPGTGDTDTEPPATDVD